MSNISWRVNEPSPWILLSLYYHTILCKWLKIWIANYWVDIMVYSMLQWSNNWIIVLHRRYRKRPYLHSLICFLRGCFLSTHGKYIMLPKPNHYHFHSVVFAVSRVALLVSHGGRRSSFWIVLCLGSMLHLSLVHGFRSHSHWLGSRSATCADYYYSWLAVCVVLLSMSL